MNNEVSYKHVQTKVDITTYLKLSEFATLQGYSIEKVTNIAIKNFLEDREVNKDGSKKVK